MSTPKINFSYNWNNKLGCKIFSTIRIYNPNKYQIGQEYKIELNKKPIKIASITDMKTIYLKDINEFIAGIDTGYSAFECKSILQKMYSKIQNLDKQPFSFILLSTIK